MNTLTAKDIVAGVEIFDLKVGIPEEKAFDLLGRYEETGLTAAEVAELAYAKADGRLKIITQEQKEARERLANYSADDSFFDDEYC